MATTTKLHYVYRITNKKNNKHYYGIRSSKIEPGLDLGIKYFSSSTDKGFIKEQKENKYLFKYKIIRICESRETAIKLEIKLHNKFDVGNNSSFYNKSKQTDVKFDRSGIRHTEETKLKISKNGKLKGMYGKSVSKETRNKISKSLKNSEYFDSLETRNKKSESKKGTKHTEETKLKIKFSKINKPRPKLICPYCNFIGGTGNMQRWHFENCKHKEIL